MHRILYAINHRVTEDAITKNIDSEYLAVGAVMYKEAILEQIAETGADTLLIRETLPGSSSLETLLKRVRVEYPEVRIIVICSERQKNDTFLQVLVGMGIYDIINSDKPTLTDIISYIRTPRTYRDAAQYGIGLPEMPQTTLHQPPDPVPSVNQPVPSSKGRGFLSDLAKGFAALKGPRQECPPQQQTAPEEDIIGQEQTAPQINFDLLRESIKQSEARKAQSELDELIRKAVDEQTAVCIKEIEELRRALEAAQTETSVAESHSVSAIQELNTLRSEKDKAAVALADSRREMQQIIDMYESQLKALSDPTNTPEWYSEQSQIWETQKKSLEKDLDERTREAEDLSFKCEALTKQAQNNAQIISDLKEQLQRAKETFISEADTDTLIGQLRSEVSEAKAANIQLEKELDKVREELSIVKENGPDFSQPIVDVPLLPDDTVYTSSSTAPQTILMIGAKHGAGGTTVAMNLAASLAGRGLKTLLIEANGRFPMCNHFFEFVHVPYGIEEAVNSIAEGNIASADKSIIRPHGLRPSKPSLLKTYKKLPAALHFMLPSNESLVTHSYEKNPLITEATIYTLLSYLAKRQQYSHIILDIQCDDFNMIKSIVNSGYQIDKLCIVLTQDSHAIVSTGTQITMLSRAHASSIVAGGEFIINKYNPHAPIPQKKIEQMLHISSAQVSKLSDDSIGYLSASNAGLPYLLNGGQSWMEYDVLRTKIFPNS